MIAEIRLSKVLIDGGSSINILNADTLQKMGISESKLQPSNTSFHGIIPGTSALPLGKISLEVIFGKSDNFWRETLSFEVVDFKSGYHAIFGRPVFAKFMAWLCYIYLKLKMHGPKGVITVKGDFKKAIEVENLNAHISDTLVAKAELEQLRKKIDPYDMMATRKPTVDPASTFQSTKDTKKILLKEDDLSKTAIIGTTLSSK